MSVVIPGMEMPKGCGLCRFDDYGYCTMAKQYSGGSATHGRASFCPLVELPEKHGRLIDGDELITAFPVCDNNMDIKIASVRATINHMPTVIEAEGED